MDKREEDILDDILGGEETEDYEEIIIPESLIGEPKDEPDEKKIDENKKENEPDLSEFLEENTEADEDDKILNKEKDKKDIKQSGDREKMESEIREQIKQEQKKKNKFIRNVSVICAAALILIAAGLFVFLQFYNFDDINIFSNKTVITIDSKKVTLSDLKLSLMLNELFNDGTSYNPDPKQTAVDDLIFYTIVDKAVKERNIVINEEDKEYLTSYIQSIKDYLTSNNLKSPNFSDKQYEFALSYMILNDVYTQLVDSLASEKNYALNEDDFIAEYEEYKLNYKTDYVYMDFKYVLAESQEKADEARNALLSGESTDEAVKKYSLDYSAETAEIPVIALSEMGFLTDDEIDHIMTLQVADITEVFYIESYAYYIVFVVETIDIPKESELKAWYRDYYDYQKKNELFYSEYELWEKEAVIKLNDKAIENFDEDAYLEEIFGAY